LSQAIKFNHPVTPAHKEQKFLCHKLSHPFFVNSRADSRGWHSDPRGAEVTSPSLRQVKGLKAWGRGRWSVERSSPGRDPSASWTFPTKV